MTTQALVMTNGNGHAALAQQMDERRKLVARTIAKGATADELDLFLHTSQRLGLDPLARQIFCVKRWSARDRRDVMSIQVSVDGFRAVAQRSGQYAGQLGPLWCGPDKQWTDVWLEKTPPAAAKVAVLRRDFSEPLWAVATWDQYAQTYKDQKTGEIKLTGLWVTMPALMLGKCAECLALRRAFPAELSGVYSPEEMDQAVVVEAEPLNHSRQLQAAPASERGQVARVDLGAMGANEAMPGDKPDADMQLPTSKPTPTRTAPARKVSEGELGLIAKIEAADLDGLDVIKDDLKNPDRYPRFLRESPAVKAAVAMAETRLLDAHDADMAGQSDAIAMETDLELAAAFPPESLMN